MLPRKKRMESPTTLYSAIDVIKIWMEPLEHVVLPSHDDYPSTKSMINNYVNNQIRENTSNHDITWVSLKCFPYLVTLMIGLQRCA